MTDSFIKQQQEEAELAVFWDEMAQHLPKSIERSALGDEKIFRAFATAYPKIKAQIIRNTCEEIERRAERVMEYPNGNFDGLWLYRGKLKDILTSITTSHE